MIDAAPGAGPVQDEGGQATSEHFANGPRPGRLDPKAGCCPRGLKLAESGTIKKNDRRAARRARERMLGAHAGAATVT